MGDWVNAAQVASGVAALAAVWLSVVTARSARRTPLTEPYMAAWRSVLEVLTVATESRDEPPPEQEADALMRQFRAADHQLSAIEATLRVRVYGRAIRGDLNNLLLDVLYDDPEIREPGDHPLTTEHTPRPAWAGCSDEQWEQVINSVPFASMWISQVWELPGRPWDTEEGLMRWYYPVVLQGLYVDPEHSVTAPGAPAQQQLAFMLSMYVDSFVLPWVRDASREALMGRLGLRGQRLRWQKRRHRWSYDPPWRREQWHGHRPMRFEPTDRSR
ncbi:hypothetical protein [Nocardioides sp. HB32]